MRLPPPWGWPPRALYIPLPGYPWSTASRGLPTGSYVTPICTGIPYEGPFTILRVVACVLHEYIMDVWRSDPPDTYPVGDIQGSKIPHLVHSGHSGQSGYSQSIPGIPNSTRSFGVNTPWKGCPYMLGSEHLLLQKGSILGPLLGPLFDPSRDPLFHAYP